MFEPIDAGLGIGSKAVDLVDTVIQKFEKYQKIKQDTTAYLRLLYIEVLNNLEVLKTINFDRYSNIKANDVKVKTILKLLQTEISESVFYKSTDNPNTELYDKLRKKGKVENKGQELVKTTVKGDDVKIKNRFVYENVLQAISFVVIKIEVMKKYSNLTDEEIDILKNMNFRVRLININQRLLMIKKVMDDFEDIKEMAR
ncbi:MAG: hypothetical protein EHM93_00050 [Bacteroidales bacterium]|nr:MAG: hypothetical protein EHM93_00050 [Bacteroidales bacterium]